MVFEQIDQITIQTGSAMPDYVFGGIIGAMIAIGILFMILFIIIIYIYTSLSLSVIARKLKYKKNWLAWIPIANFAIILQLGEFHWAWIFLVLIPVLGWMALFVLLIIATWRIFEKRKYPGWFALSILLPTIGGIFFLVLTGFVAWKDRKKRMTF